MKQNFLYVALLFLTISLVSTSHSTARKLIITTKQGEAGVKLNKIRYGDFHLQKESTNSFDKLMGAEECPNEDEERLRRVVLESHLDYIYTQHHKP
ncbi:putative phytosulfokines 6 [Olea europaea var. sylvestris]|uniref:Phytosulfokine n=1 Tax=Olea europaea subsp. europaea TaxID=158383 RepID=A0A8S0QKD4_OLEEU|nr:putative phytosulfokines 6 [Olea europaea var. sylvestris]CAA2966170.1 phytosulfokines 6 [Olea europaea subsp. europaea]